MRFFKLIFVLSFCISLFSCASGAKMENMVFHGDKKTYPDEIQNNMHVGKVSGGKKTNPLLASAIDNKAFSGAVKESLKTQGLYSKDGNYQLEIQILKVNKPVFGFNLKVTTHVRYILTNKVDSSVVLDETIIAFYTAGVSDAFVGIKRLRLANEGSAKKNIEGLLEKLSQMEMGANKIALVE